jgi:hypothetical protein
MRRSAKFQFHPILLLSNLKSIKEPLHFLQIILGSSELETQYLIKLVIEFIKMKEGGHANFTSIKS